VNSNRAKALTAWLIKQTRKLDKSTSWGEINVILLDDKQITEINQQVFSRTKATDVIALRYNPLPGIDDCSTAELFINVQRTNLATTRNGWNPSKELALYIAHGCDHLAGACDDSLEEYNRMRRRELRWLRMATKLGMTDSLIF
jgi:rRNA maturation RNase YbeY